MSEVCGFVVFAYFFVRFLWHLPIFLAVFMWFAVSMVACGLRFFAKIWCGFLVSGYSELRFCGSNHLKTLNEFLES